MTIEAEKQQALAARVGEVATAALEARGYVSSIDVLMGLGWLTPTRVDEWRARKLPFLEAGVPTNPVRVAEAMKVFRAWAEARGLKPSETGYVARTASKQRLRFTELGVEEIEQAYRTHWLSPSLLAAKKPSPA